MTDNSLVMMSGYTFPKAFRWIPQPDITAYELALALPIFMHIGRFDWEPYIKEHKLERHFEELP